VATFAKSETSNEYWEDKRARLDKIEVPTYILGSYSTGLHTLGAVRAFEEIKHNQKWCVPLWGREEVLELDSHVSAGLPSMIPKNGTTCILTNESKIWISFSASTSRAMITVGSRQLP
jgi:hypothetical protein